VSILAAAAGHCEGEMFFETGPEEPTGWGHLIMEKKGSAGATRVPVVPLDEVIRDQSVSFLKVDVEGAESLVFRGCERLLKRRAIQNIYFEQNGPGAASLGLPTLAARNWLVSLGYRVRLLGSNTGKDIVDCWAEPG
jgi:hypothetical protein